MKRVLGTGMAVALFGSTALASGLNMRVVSNNSDSIQVGPGETVNYQVLGVLTDTNNQGLALIGFDLALPTVVLPQVAPGAQMASFVSPEGIGNPAGFGGTTDVPEHEGELIQCGGGQNTINNTAGNAPFPIGAVVLNLGHSEIVIAEGSLTAPNTKGFHTLAVSSIFANAIKQVQPPGIDYLVVEEVTPVSGLNLTIEVTDAAPCTLALTDPPNCAIDARQPSRPDGTVPRGWNTIEMTFGGTCALGGLSAGDVSVTVTNGVAPGVSDINCVGSVCNVGLDAFIPLRAWTCVEVLGLEACLGALPADVSNDRTSSAPDILWLIDCLNGVRTCEIFQCDVDASAVCGPPDILRTIDLLNGASTFDPWLNLNIPVCPSAGP